MGRIYMSLLEDASLLSFYFISQSSQKIPYQEGIEDHQNSMSQSKKQTGATFEGEFIPGNSDYSLKREDNPKAPKKYLY
jgi:hypothetical protein